MRFPVVVGLLTLAACTPAPGVVMPAGLAPVERSQVDRWVAGTTPTGADSIAFGFVFTDARSATAKGHGTIRLVAPDSVRLDFVGPLGAGRGAAVVFGDSTSWAEPKDKADQFVPNYPLFWAMIGVARAPDHPEALRGLEDDRTTWWQYASGGDTVNYVLTRGRPHQLIAEVRLQGKRLGQVVTTLDSAGKLVRARLVTIQPASKLELTFRRQVPVSRFDQGIWDAPHE